jgi:dihydroorotase
MITIENVKTVSREKKNFEFESEVDQIINGDQLLALPAVIDPHVHFRAPGLEYKEDWRSASIASLKGGCTTVFDMPNTLPPTITAQLLHEKKALIDQQLKEVNVPLRYDLFFGADKHHLDEIPKVKKQVIGIKVFMGCSTGNLVIDDDESLHAVFEIAAKEEMLVAVHAEDEHLIRARKRSFQGEMNYEAHSKLRDIEVATTAVSKAISLAKQYGTRLYILHVSSEDEVALIKQAKQEGLSVFAETTPHHLFFNDSYYEKLKGKAVVNPPLREAKHQAALMKAIHEKIIDTIGSDHAPHTLSEKERPYGECPSGMPGIEFMLPSLLNAYHREMLSLQEIVSLTSTRAREIFHLPSNDDWVLVDLNKVLTITKTESKCGFTPYAGLTLKGHPIYTILKGRVFWVENKVVCLT